MTISFVDDDFEAFLVIDSVINETSSGGVRIAPDVDVGEVRALAREMTLKYSLFRLPRGGAKMGIRLSDQLSPNAKDVALRNLGRKLGPLIRRGIYYPGPDMNCGPLELRAIYAGAGLTMGSLCDTSFFTALSVENAIEACYDWSGATGVLTVAIEGFGRVAGHLAERLSPERYRIVAISTLFGAVRDSSGFDGPHLAARRSQLGDQVVDQVGGQKMALEELLVGPVDLLLPSTRTGVITHGVGESTQAKMIVPIANAPYAEGVAECLHRRGVLCLPGFVSNAGGVFGSTMYDRGMTEAAVTQTIDDFYRPMVRQLVHRAWALGLSPVEVAEVIASRERDARSALQPLSGRTTKFLRLAARRLPKRFGAGKARRHFVESMQTVIQELENFTP
jgi:glutamate dehydrogenase/leucine dehydrogenase